jgi:hypothetical protein
MMNLRGGWATGLVALGGFATCRDSFSRAIMAQTGHHCQHKCETVGGRKLPQLAQDLLDALHVKMTR